MDTNSEATLRRHYAKTALARMGIEYGRGMAVDAVRIAVEGAAKAEQRRMAQGLEPDQNARRNVDSIC